MSEVIKRIWKRRRYPVAIGEGDDAETFHVRALTFSELEALDAISDGLLKTFFTVGLGLVDPSGVQLYPREESETPEQYGDRVKAACVDIPTDTLFELSVAIGKVEKTPKLGNLAKN